MDVLQFKGAMIPYDRFIHDLSASIARMIKADSDGSRFVCQREAYRLFGRRNVERWRRQGLIKFCKRPGKVEYLIADLRLLQQREQDYFTDLPLRKKPDNERESRDKALDQ